MSYYDERREKLEQKTQKSLDELNEELKKANPDRSKIDRLEREVAIGKLLLDRKR